MTGNTLGTAEEKSRKKPHSEGEDIRQDRGVLAVLGPTEEDLPLDDVVQELCALPLADLRDKWKAAHLGLQLPDKLPRDLLVRSIVWAIECAQEGGLPSGAERALEKMSRQIATTGTLEIERAVRPKPGTRLIREWRGKTYVVEVSDHGFTHDEQTYSSLSHVARAITGTRWSGPRFFGLRPEDVEGVGDGAEGGQR